MWHRNSMPNTFEDITINGNVNGTPTFQDYTVYNQDLILNSQIQINQGEEPGIWYGLPGGSTRTTFGLQCRPRFGNSWYTTGSGPEQLVASRYPGGFIHFVGRISNNTGAFRRDGVYVLDFNATAFAQTFRPSAEIHMLLDGADRANNQQPVLVLGTDGNAYCYNLNNTANSQFDYRINCMYNKWTVPGKNEGTGGF